ncbi:MAG: uroporphyrinogen-III C-methyltransferase [Acidovorax sp.]
MSEAPPLDQPPSPPRSTGNASRAGWFILGVVAVAGAASSGLLWQKLSNIQEQLARQSASTGEQAIEARTLARQAEDLSRATAARLTVAESRLAEVGLQRTQLDELMQSLSRSRDENLVVDIDSGLRLAQQQAQLTGTLEPLVAALKSANQRIERAAQPRLAPVQRAIAQDLDRVARASVTDTAGILARLDDMARLVDELPTLNAVAPASAMRRPAPAGTTAAPSPGGDWQDTLLQAWDSFTERVAHEARGLVRVSRIDQPDAMLLAPEQAYFLRENIKLKLLNARLAVLGRQYDSARTDLAAIAVALNKYFDPAARRTQNFATQMQQVQGNLKTAELPRLDETLAALATAAAGR